VTATSCQFARMTSGPSRLPTPSRGLAKGVGSREFSQKMRRIVRVGAVPVRDANSRLPTPRAGRC
jgi:hypothetical protein